MKIIDRICPVCTVTYKANTTRLKFGRQTTCSSKCSYKFRSKKIKKSINTACGNCDKPLIKTPCQMKNKHHLVFCNPSCQYEARRKGLTPRIVSTPYKITPVSIERKKEIAQKIWNSRRKNGTNKHSKATKEKLSEITTLNIASGKINRISNIEYKVADELITNKIKFIHQYAIRNTTTGRYCACIDFFLPDHNIAIEVNGTFWHADKRFYDRSNLYSSQIRTLERYSKKLIILESLQFKLVEIWEEDINKSPETFIDPLLKSIG